MDEHPFDSFRPNAWRKLFDSYKNQAEAQFDAFKTRSTKSAEAVQDART